VDLPAAQPAGESERSLHLQGAAWRFGWQAGG
jgi:hypothetical protein